MFTALKGSQFYFYSVPDIFGTRRNFDTRSVTEHSSGKYFAASLGLVTELWLGLGLITDLSSGSYIDACSDRPRAKARLGLRARVGLGFGPRHVR